MSNTNSVPKQWQTLSQEADQAITAIATRHIPYLSGNERNVAKAHLKDFMMEFVELVNSETGKNSDAGSKETLEIVYDFLQSSLKTHGIGFEEINDEYWVSNQAQYLKQSEAQNHE